MTIVGKLCPNCSSSLASPDDEAACAALRTLKEQGWAQQLEDGSWQLQRAALQEIAITQQVCDPQPMCHVPEQAALTDLSAFQLCLVLQQRGWKWKKHAPKKSPAYVLGGPLLWYTAGKVVIRDYALTLLQAESILEYERPEDEPSPRCIHHCRPSKYYRMLLDGEYQKAQLCLHGRSSKELPATEGSAGMLAADEGFFVQPVNQPALPAPPPSNVRSPLDKGTSAKRKREDARSSSDSCASELERLLDEDSSVEPGSPGEWGSVSDEDEAANLASNSNSNSSSSKDVPGQGIAPHDASNLDPVPLNPEKEPQPVPAILQPTEPSASARPVPERSASPEAAFGKRVVQPQTIPCWGKPGFRITYRVAKGKQPASWQGTCPYHRKSAATRCTKAVTFSTEDESDACLRRIKNWLVQGPTFLDAKTHSSFHPRFADAPPHEVLDAQAESLSPAPAVVIPDDEHEKVEGVKKKVEERRAKAKAKVAAKGKAVKAKAEPKTKTCKRKAKPQPAGPASRSPAGEPEVARSPASERDARPAGSRDGAPDQPNSESSGSSSDSDSSSGSSSSD